MAKDFLKNNKNFNLYNPDPTIFDYFEKKKTVKELNNSGELDFGRTYGPIYIDEKFDGWITDMVLRIELPSLIEADPGGNGYLNWVDSIGHSIIESITLKAFGKEIISSQIDYGLWLDIQNELNDENNEEWSLIGKNADYETMKIYETSINVLYIPLHFWFSKNNDSAFPQFLVNKSNNIRDMCLSLTIKTRPIQELINSFGDVAYSTYKDKKITSIDIIYDSIRAENNNNDIELTKTIDNLYNSYKNVNNPYRIYFDNYKMHHQLLDTIVDCSNILVDGPVKYIYFVIRHNNRIDRDIDITQTNLAIPLNENDETNQNDIFNYSNITPSYWGTYDTFKNLTVYVENNSKHWVTDKPKLDSIYYRKLTSYISKTHIPKKNIYTIDFSNSKDIGNYEINGYLNNNSNKRRNVHLEFEVPMADSTITLIYHVINYLNVHVDSENKLKCVNHWDNTLANSKNNTTLSNDLKLSSSMNNTTGIVSSDIWYNQGIGTTLLGLNPQWDQNFGEIGRIANSNNKFTAPNVGLKLSISLEGIATQNYLPTLEQTKSIFGFSNTFGEDIIEIINEDVYYFRNYGVIRINKNNVNNNIFKSFLNVSLEEEYHSSLTIFTGNKIRPNEFLQLNILNSDVISFNKDSFECFLTGNGNNTILKHSINKNTYKKIKLLNNGNKDTDLLPGSFIYFEKNNNMVNVKMVLRCSNSIITPILG